MKVLGTPNKEQIQSMNSNYKEYKFPLIKPVPLQKLFKSRGTDEDAEFLSKLLVYNPRERLTPMQALNDKYFDELKKKAVTLPNGKPLPEIFNLTQGSKIIQKKLSSPVIHYIRLSLNGIRSHLLSLSVNYSVYMIIL
jgi:glycogen synthase kinase 3 beta